MTDYGSLDHPHTLSDLDIPDWACSMVNRWRGDAVPVMAAGQGVSFECGSIECALEFSDDAARRGHYTNRREGTVVTIFRGRAAR